MTTDKALRALSRAVGLMGGVRPAARLMAITPQTIDQWLSGRRPVPLDRCVEVEIAVARRVTCEQIRPDKRAMWRYLRESNNPALETA